MDDASATAPSPSAPPAVDNNSNTSSDDGNKSPFFLVGSGNESGLTMSIPDDKVGRSTPPGFESTAVSSEAGPSDLDGPPGFEKKIETATGSGEAKVTAASASPTVGSAESNDQHAGDGESKASTKASASPIPEDEGATAATETEVEEHPSDVLFWRNPLKSTLLLGTGTFFYWLFLRGYSALTTVSLLLLCNLMLNTVFVVLCKTPLPQAFGLIKEGEDPRDKVMLLPNAVRQLLSSQHVALLLSYASCVVANIESRVCESLKCSDVKVVVTAGAALFLVSLVGSCFSAITLLYMAFLGALTLPVTYRRNQTFIDAKVSQARSRVLRSASAVADAAVRKFPKLQKVRNYVTPHKATKED